MPGPPPKRTTQRRRRNKPKDGDITVITPDSASRPKPPRVSASWHPLMKDWFRSLKESGQSAFYEPSDWQTARLIAEIMSRQLKSDEGVKASMLAEFNRTAASLMTTEGERRRLRIELQKPESDSTDLATVSVIAEYKDLLG